MEGAHPIQVLTERQSQRAGRQYPRKFSEEPESCLLPTSANSRLGSDRCLRSILLLGVLTGEATKGADVRIDVVLSPASDHWLLKAQFLDISNRFRSLLAKEVENYDNDRDKPADEQKGI